jgi:hypothetical protein
MKTPYAIARKMPTENRVLTFGLEFTIGQIYYFTINIESPRQIKYL